MTLSTLTHNKTRGRRDTSRQEIPVEEVRPLTPQTASNDANFFTSVPDEKFAEFTISQKAVEKNSRTMELHALRVAISKTPTFIFRVQSKNGLDRAIAIQSPKIALRIRNAWQMGAAEQLIASASISGNSLFVVDCALNTWNIPFHSLPALKAIPGEARDEFEIDEDGSFLYWKSTDTHIDLEALKVGVDPELRERLNAERLLSDQHFGMAVASVRKKFKLRQVDISEINVRQIRRIEKGSRPRLDTLRKLAKAHNLDLNDYLNEIAKAIVALRR